MDRSNTTTLFGFPDAEDGPVIGWTGLRPRRGARSCALAAARQGVDVEPDVSRSWWASSGTGTGLGNKLVIRRFWGTAADRQPVSEQRNGSLK